MAGNETPNNEMDDEKEITSSDELLKMIYREFSDLKTLLWGSKQEILNCIAEMDDIELRIAGNTKDLEDIEEFMEMITSGNLEIKSVGEREIFWTKFSAIIRNFLPNAKETGLQQKSMISRLNEIQGWIQQVQTEVKIITSDIELFYSKI